MSTNKTLNIKNISILKQITYALCTYEYTYLKTKQYNYNNITWEGNEKLKKKKKNAI